jgi:hypothetical protein
LPQENGGNVDAPVPHGTQDGDLLDFRQHRHCKDIKNAEASEQDDQRNSNRDGHSQGQKKLQCALLAFLPARGVVLKQRFETAGQRRRTIRITQFVYYHRRAGRLLQKGLRHSGMGVNPSRINRANACARDCGNGEPPVFAVGREQLHGVADASLK